MICSSRILYYIFNIQFSILVWFIFQCIVWSIQTQYTIMLVPLLTLIKNLGQWYKTIRMKNSTCSKKKKKRHDSPLKEFKGEKKRHNKTEWGRIYLLSLNSRLMDLLQIYFSVMKTNLTNSDNKLIQILWKLMFNTSATQ